MIRSIFEILLLSFTIFAESSGEPKEGRIAVASVIRNRVQFYDKSYTEVILQANQFSCWNSNEVLKHVSRLELKPFKECLVIALGIYSNNIKDNTNEALWYVRHNIEKVWMKQLKISVTYNNHIFLTKG